LIVEPDAEVVQSHPRHQAHTQTLKLMGPLPPEARLWTSHKASRCTMKRSMSSSWELTKRLNCEAIRMGRSETKRGLRASGVVRSLPSSITSPLPCRGGRGVGVYVAEVQSGSHLRLFAATIHSGPILLPTEGVRARRTFANPKGTAYRGSAFSSSEETPSARLGE
jgi:hypothetical protein